MFGIGPGIGGEKVRNRLGCAVGQWSLGTERLGDLPSGTETSVNMGVWLFYGGGAQECEIGFLRRWM